MDTLNGLILDIAELKKRVSVLETQACPRWVWTSSPGWIGGKNGDPLTSVSWDGDAYSTTAKTLIDLSVVFGTPANIKAVSARIACRDSASVATNNLCVLISPNATDGASPVIARPSGLVNDYFAEAEGICPCDANGDIYYQIAASGASTMDIYMQIWGYLI